MTGRLYGVGVGPGDPELMTIKARRLIEDADVVAYPVARRVAAPHLSGQVELALTYPVTTEDTDHPEGYDGALRDFYDESARRIAEHLDAGRDVVQRGGRRGRRAAGQARRRADDPAGHARARRARGAPSDQRRGRRAQA